MFEVDYAFYFVRVCKGDWWLVVVTLVKPTIVVYRLSML
jgi:hypothetical protein